MPVKAKPKICKAPVMTQVRQQVGQIVDLMKDRKDVLRRTLIRFKYMIVSLAIVGGLLSCKPKRTMAGHERTAQEISYN